MATFLTNLDLSKNELQNARAQNLATPPQGPAEGQLYYDSVKKSFAYYNGTEWTYLDGTKIKKLSGTIATGQTSATLTYGAGHEPVSAYAVDAVSGEIVMTDIVLDTTLGKATFTIAESYSNAINIAVFYVKSE